MVSRELQTAVTKSQLDHNLCHKGKLHWKSLPLFHSGECSVETPWILKETFDIRPNTQSGIQLHSEQRYWQVLHRKINICLMFPHLLEETKQRQTDRFFRTKGRHVTNRAAIQQLDLWCTFHSHSLLQARAHVTGMQVQVALTGGRLLLCCAHKHTALGDFLLVTSQPIFNSDRFFLLSSCALC